MVEAIARNICEPNTTTLIRCPKIIKNNTAELRVMQRSVNRALTVLYKNSNRITSQVYTISIQVAQMQALPLIYLQTLGRQSQLFPLTRISNWQNPATT